MSIRIGLAALLLATSFALASVAGTVAAPLACSADETWDPVAESDVIIGGQILGYDELEGRESGSFVEVSLSVRVDHLWKGEFRGETIVDRTSLLGPQYVTIPDRWAGASGACGALDDDPTGKYAVLGLRREGSELRTNRLTTFYLDPAPYDVRAISSGSGRPLGLPVAGIPGADASAPTQRIMLATGAAVAAMGVLVQVLRRRNGRGERI